MEAHSLMDAVRSVTRFARMDEHFDDPRNIIAKKKAVGLNLGRIALECVKSLSQKA